jgi:malonyl CoA-acyl carrier protein transacylase
MSIAYLFPGQGSQTKGMGAALFDRFSDWTAEADAVLGYSIRGLCLDDPRQELGLTQFTQPALFVVNAMTFRARHEDGQPAPAFAAGHSLGEYNALVAAGVFDFASGLRMVQQRGALMGRVGGWWHGGGHRHGAGRNRGAAGRKRRGPPARRGELQLVRTDGDSRARRTISPR